MINNSKAYGGGDHAEDVIGALEEATKLDFYSKTCLIYLICDAPSHGWLYHDGNVSDNYPIIEINSLETQIKKLKNLPNTNVYFTAFTLNTSTDKMF